MNAASIIVIAIIVILSILAVATAEEPLDEVFHVKAAMNGFSFPPLATKIVSQPNEEHQMTATAGKVEPPKPAQNEEAENNELKRLTPYSAVSC